MIYEAVFDGKPIHRGQGGPIMPKVEGWLVVFSICAGVLFAIWKGVKRSDLDFLRNWRR